MNFLIASNTFESEDFEHPYPIPYSIGTDNQLFC